MARDPNPSAALSSLFSHELAPTPRQRARLHARDGLRALRTPPASAGGRVERPVPHHVLPRVGGPAEPGLPAPAGDLPLLSRRVPPLAPPDGFQALPPRGLQLLLSEMRHLSDRRILFFGGKGGVGKTTCASAVALAASRRGKRVLLVSTDPAHSTSDIFGTPFAADEREIHPGLYGLEVDANLEARRYIDNAKAGIARMFSPAVAKEAGRQIELASSMPGVEEVALFDR